MHSSYVLHFGAYTRFGRSVGRKEVHYHLVAPRIGACVAGLVVIDGKERDGTAWSLRDGILILICTLDDFETPHLIVERSFLIIH